MLINAITQEIEKERILYNTIVKKISYQDQKYSIKIGNT
jgi:hypothetical protein